ncbi:(2Fe-2S)-binding protein [Saccharothrix sp. ST-888]|uniref:(2Fe-2S)-binding protein n=1 Tax=Saccharothrix sp. ST-888 TaxID=1427391 RepID=UPI0018CF7EF3|nr:(2Fe-2S)-binding protein [Saccharothrix sp. ST-888]
MVDICGTLRVDILTPGRPAPMPGRELLGVAGLSDGGVRVLVAAEAARIEAEHGRAPRTHVAASRLLHHLLWSAALLFSGPWYLTGEVPRLGARDCWIDAATGGLTVRPATGALGGEAELRDAVAAFVGPLLDAFAPYVKRGQRALWGMAADDLLSGIWYLGRMLGEEEHAIRVAGAVLPGDTRPFPGAADFRLLHGTSGRTHPTRTRLGCCLYYAIRPAEACITCPRTCDEERVRRLEL